MKSLSQQNNERIVIRINNEERTIIQSEKHTHEWLSRALHTRFIIYCRKIIYGYIYLYKYIRIIVRTALELSLVVVVVFFKYISVIIHSN